MKIYCYIEVDNAEDDYLDYIGDEETSFYKSMKELLQCHDIGGGTVLTLDVVDIGTVVTNAKYVSSVATAKPKKKQN